ncbi:MAG: mannonate dehydratase [Ruminococcaceae bacterium]|nr:mannonate dehydratase [Oscillospiraceae bacterium]
MRLADYLLSEESLQWDYARQMGVKYAVGRMPDGHMEKTAESLELLSQMKQRYTDGGFELKVIEPAPLNQKIKQNLPGRDEEIERMCTLIKNMGKLGIEVLCYNFATHFNWSRTDMAVKERGGALVTGYRHDSIDQSMITEAGIITAEELWANLEYLQRAIVPVAEEAGVKLALHPDDPPVDSIQGVARILNSADAMEKACNLVPSKNMGICMCQGTFVEMGGDIYENISRFAKQGRIHLVHFRDVRGNKYDFHETFHDNGVTDMAKCVRLYDELCPDAYVRVDHVPTMAGEDNTKPGYCSLGRLYAIGYLKGLMEMNQSK